MKYPKLKFVRVKKNDPVHPFLMTIVEHPTESGPRHVLHDWLEEQGDRRAKIVREIQPNRARMCSLLLRFRVSKEIPVAEECTRLVNFCMNEAVLLKFSGKPKQKSAFYEPTGAAFFGVVNPYVEELARSIRWGPYTHGRYSVTLGPTVIADDVTTTSDNTSFLDGGYIITHPRDGN